MIYNLKIRKIIKDEKFSAIRTIWTSILAKSIASFLTYPHIVLRSRFQDFQNLAHQNYYYKVCMKSKNIPNLLMGSGKRLSLVSLVSNMFRQEGIRGFYRGFKSDFLKIVMMNTVFMLIFEKIRYYLGNTIH